MTLDDLNAPFAGQGLVQVGELILAFALASMIGLERELRSKSAGLRTQTIVGTASALMVLVGKYGFNDVLVAGSVGVDPSRVAAQVISGVGFLGAGLIITHRGAVHGLTTAASVWETAAIGMAAGAGLWVLALVVTGLHFVVVFGYTAFLRAIPRTGESSISVDVVYADGQGVLREILSRVTAANWNLRRLTRQDTEDPLITSVRMVLAGNADSSTLLARIGSMDGVHSVDRTVIEELE